MKTKLSDVTYRVRVPRDKEKEYHEIPSYDLKVETPRVLLNEEAEQAFLAYVDRYMKQTM